MRNHNSSLISDDDGDDGVKVEKDVGRQELSGEKTEPGRLGRVREA